MVNFSNDAGTSVVFDILSLKPRFAGSEFPPIIVFKIFHKSGGHGNKYITGKRAIRPASEVITLWHIHCVSDRTLYS